MSRRSPTTAETLLVALALALATAAAGARDSDREAPARIEADRAEIDRAAGVSRYYGNVVYTQGTLRITGERVTVRAPEGEVRYAESNGRPATVRQETNAGDLVRAQARTIVYRADIPRVTLTGAAELHREGDRFAAGQIRYWPDTGRVEADQGEDGGRVEIRIAPEDGDAPADPDE
jgi:lipopolysaccharide export system protein LptA